MWLYSSSWGHPTQHVFKCVVTKRRRAVPNWVICRIEWLAGTSWLLKKVAGFRIQMGDVLKNQSYWTAFEARSFEDFTVGLVVFVAKTSLVVFGRHNCPALSAYFQVSFAGRCFPLNEHVFLHRVLIFPSSLAQEQADKKPCCLL